MISAGTSSKLVRIRNKLSLSLPEEPLRYSPRLGEGAQRHARHAQFLMHRLQLRRLLQRPQQIHDGVEEQQQHPTAVLVQMPIAIAGHIPLAAHFM